MSLISLDLLYDRRMAGRPKANLELTETQRQELERMTKAGTSEKRMVFRARLILECATGADNVAGRSDFKYEPTDCHVVAGELLAECGLSVDHVTVWRWVQRYAPEPERRLRRHLKPTNDSWRVDETYVP